ncbi:MAG TPA: MYXO-CTERM sorting domain-containing protein [Kofleriaceae bacterium]|jgi:hypothetical protein|nr:MYXO-CTERM sorting domain-containing protein [Kofleriaceae bacterium]
MRTPLVTTAVAALLLAASPAHALQHLMHVNEVFLDDGTGAQYIELNDSNGEPFSNSYELHIYDADGGEVGVVALPSVAANQTFYMVANATAVGVFGLGGAGANDAVLDVTLPADGEACFETTTGSRIHCVAWGCINTPVGNPNRGASPPEGMSLSRPAGAGLYQVTNPTPGAANDTGTADPSCPTMIDAGPGPDANPNAPDAGIGPDAGDGGGDGGGCCHSGNGAPGALGGTMLLAALALFAGRRRR